MTFHLFDTAIMVRKMRRAMARDNKDMNHRISPTSKDIYSKDRIYWSKTLKERDWEV
jgi:hypothetical protein